MILVFNVYFKNSILIGIHSYVVGPYGSGKSLCAQKIIQNITSELVDDSRIVFFLNLDPHTLFQCEMEKFCSEISNEYLVCKNILEISMEAGLPKLLSLSECLNVLAKQYPTKTIDVVAEEIDGQYLDDQQAVNIKTIFKSQPCYQQANVVFIFQSMDKLRTSVDRPHNGHQFEATGMRQFILEETMRFSNNIQKVSSTAQKVISKMKSTFYLPKADSKKSPQINRRDERRQSSQQSQHYSNTEVPSNSYTHVPFYARSNNEDSPTTSFVGHTESQQTISPPNDTFLRSADLETLAKVSNLTEDVEPITTEYKYLDSISRHGIDGKPLILFRVNPNIKECTNQVSTFLNTNCYANGQYASLMIFISTDRLNLVQKALDACNLKTCTYFNESRVELLLSSKQKLELFKEWQDSESILLTDSAGCRGLEHDKVSSY